MPDELDAAIDALYQAPLAEFVTTRNALAARLRQAGDRDAAGMVKALSKPGPVAWVLNRLRHQEPDAFEALLDAGDEVRSALAAGDRSGMERAGQARDEVLGALTSRAGALYRQAGAATDDLRRRVRMSLEALAAHGRTATAPRLGRLATDVPPPAVGALAALVPSGSAGRARRARPATRSSSASDSGRARQREAEIALDQTEREQARLDRVASAAEAEANTRRSAHDAARRGVTMLERRLEDAVAFERKTREALEAAEKSHKEAARTAAAAARRTEAARSAVARVRTRRD